MNVQATSSKEVTAPQVPAATPANTTLKQMKGGDAPVAQQAKESTPVPATEFEKFLTNKVVDLLAWRSNEAAIRDMGALVKKNLTVIASLGTKQKLKFTSNGEIGTRGATLLADPYQNFRWNQPENRISNLKKFSEFINAFFLVMMANGNQTTPDQETQELYQLLRKAARGLENLRQLYAENKPTKDEEKHEEITNNCIKNFVTLSTLESNPDEFLKYIYGSFNSIKQEASNQANAAEKIIRFSHLIEPFIKILKKKNDDDLSNVYKLIECRDGYFRDEYLTVVLACYFAISFNEMNITNQNPTFLKQTKTELNDFCGKIIQKRQAAQLDVSSKQADREAADLKILEEINKRLWLLFLNMLNAREITVRERESTDYSQYGEMFVLLGAAGVIGATVMVPAVVPTILVTVATEGTLNAINSLKEKHKDKLPNDHIFVQLKSYYEVIETLHKKHNGNLNAIIDELQKEYVAALAGGERIKSLLTFFKTAKDEANNSPNDEVEDGSKPVG